MVVHVQAQNKDVIGSSINKNWCFLNNDINDSSGRIWVGWNPLNFSINLLHSASQAIFLEVTTCRNLKFVVTFVYGDNDNTNRVAIWNDLIAFSGGYDLPWVVLGDFNEILNFNERIGSNSSSSHISSMNHFNHCVEISQLFDLPFSGDFYTWSNKLIDPGRIMSKIDRVLANIEWTSVFTQSKDDFLAPGISDHSSMVVSVYEKRLHGPPPFRFFNYLTNEPDFLDIVRSVWEEKVNGNPMFILVSKLKKVKKRLITLRRERFVNVSEAVPEAKQEMINAQAAIQSNPLSASVDTEDKSVVRSGSPGINDPASDFIQFSKIVSTDDAARLISSISRDEIVHVLSCTGSSKAPGPDRFTSHFFKVCWFIVEADFIRAIQNFFTSFRLLGERQGPPRCALKIDIRKVYDTVSWDDVVLCLKRLGFPDIFISWIYNCISTAKFAVLVNGSPYGYFSSSRGLRQGCPLSPYLFVSVMEILSLSLKYQVDIRRYDIHPRYKLTNLTHLCFVDDILVFFKGSISASTSLKSAIDDFSQFSGLEINKSKTALYSSAVNPSELAQIVTCLDCSTDELPMRYLGVPLITSKLSYQNCLPLILKVSKRAKSWKSKKLSYAGRLFLIKIVLMRMIFFWLSCFILPKRVFKELNSIFKRFLWAGVDLGKTYHPIKWSVVCSTYNKGGLGVRDIHIANCAANLRHMWDIVSGKSTIWTTGFKKISSKGVVLRVNSREVVAATKGGVPAISVNAHELQGVELGFNLAIMRGFKKVHLAIDSMETNRAADCLASYHPPIKWVDIGVEDFSPELCEIIKEDSEGKLYPRS
ncbi:uncharacterized protein LOC113358007 [Papaver somniferum]|uniref:uncharacterized protein LOC113358007 n=1 Tax=Papaver somniferum TaxID=3469 RepID=UPI000E6FB0B6|nr:uncharacterized protein LOC113358007 [Papaver somniferum]